MSDIVMKSSAPDGETESQIVAHQYKEKTPMGTEVEVVRLLNGDYGLSFTRFDNTVELRTRLRLGETAMAAIAKAYAEIKDKPLVATWTVEVTEKKKEPKKKKRKRLTSAAPSTRSTSARRK